MCDLLETSQTQKLHSWVFSSGPMCLLSWVSRECK